MTEAQRHLDLLNRLTMQALEKMRRGESPVLHPDLETYPNGCPMLTDWRPRVDDL